MIHIRGYSHDDAPILIDLHDRAIHALADCYPAEIINNWIMGQAALERFEANAANEMRFVAENNGTVAGFAGITVDRNEVRACYVDPDHAQCGIGGALMNAVEAYAQDNGLTYLAFDAAPTAESFYNALGYQTLHHGQHEMPNGAIMPCVHMYKEL